MKENFSYKVTSYFKRFTVVEVHTSTSWRRQYIAWNAFSIAEVNRVVNDMLNDIEREMMELADLAAQQYG